ncbi:MAG TPA: hypothetical protein VEA40_24365 [Ramlibacter sp.]|nr:hypothetical protein [Ramlibacter sp.]
MQAPDLLLSILVADTGGTLEVLRGELPARWALTAAGTLEQAKSLLREDTPLVVCDCHFDDGRMYDLLRYLKSRPQLQSVPFLAVRAREGELDDAMYESIKIAVDALGGDGFVDLFRWRVRYGEAEAARRLARRAQALALGTPGQQDSG